MLHLNSLLSRSPLCGLLHGASRERGLAPAVAKFPELLPKLLRSPEGGGFLYLGAFLCTATTVTGKNMGRSVLRLDSQPWPYYWNLSPYVVADATHLQGCCRFGVIHMKFPGQRLSDPRPYLDGNSCSGHALRFPPASPSSPLSVFCRLIFSCLPLKLWNPQCLIFDFLFF